MNSEIESYLRTALAEEARNAPSPNGLAGMVRQRFGHRRRALWLSSAFLAVAAVLSIVFITLLSAENSEDVVSGNGEVVQPLPESDWPGVRISFHALEQGVLAVTEGGCYYLDRGAGTPVLGLLWPQGWTAVTMPDGTREVRNEHNELALQPGDEIRVVGGYSVDPPRTADICSLGEGVWFPMNEVPTKVSR